VAKCLARRGINKESVVTIEYFLAMQQPEMSDPNDHPDWVSAVRGFGGDAPSFVTGCYDGVIRAFANDATPSTVTHGAHVGPITSVWAGQAGGKGSVVSTSKDRLAKIWNVTFEEGGLVSRIDLSAVCVGHQNSVECCDVWQGTFSPFSLPPFLPLFLCSFFGLLPSLVHFLPWFTSFFLDLPPSLIYFLPSLMPFLDVLPSFLSYLLPSLVYFLDFLNSLLPSSLPSFRPSFLPSFRYRCCRDGLVGLNS
jgi:WD40 repeat protein